MLHVEVVGAARLRTILLGLEFRRTPHGEPGVGPGHPIPDPKRGASSFVNLLGAALTLFTPNLRTGATPGFHVDKPEAGTGASGLLDCLHRIREGHGCPVTVLPEDEERAENKLLAQRIGGANMIVWDNVQHYVCSQALAAYETGPSFQGRKLGHSERVTVATDAPLFYTTNRGRFDKQSLRRKVPIRLDAGVPDPALRTGFKYDPISEAVIKARPKLVWALHVVITWWLKNDRPKPKNVPAFGSFTEWVNCIGGILECAGVPGLLANRDAYMAAKNTEGDGQDELATAMLYHLALTKQAQRGTDFSAAELYASAACRGGMVNGPWAIEAVELDEKSTVKAVRQLSTRIKENLEGKTFKCLPPVRAALLWGRCSRSLRPDPRLRRVWMCPQERTWTQVGNGVATSGGRRR